MFFDTHCHPYLSKLKSENDVLESIQKQNNQYITSVWVDLETSKRCYEIAKKYDFAYASVWIHPCDIWKYKNLDETIKELEKLAKNNKVVAIWECWLDYYRLPPKTESEKSIEEIKSLQKQFFIAQIELAKKLNLPVIIHNREAKDDILEILKSTDCKNFIMHCFSENLDFANACLDFAPKCMISFSWILTFNSAKDIQETASKIPLKNILIETDSPYLTPTPFRWQENYPNYVQYVFEKLCILRNESREEVEKQVWDNSLKMFKIEKS